MLKWNCDFQIPRSTIQLSIVFIKIISFENIETDCKINLSFEDEQFNQINTDDITIFGNYDKTSDIYKQLLNVYLNSEII